MLAGGAYNIIAHIFFIGTTPYKRVESAYNSIKSNKGFLLESCCSEAVRENLREAFPEIESFHALLEEDSLHLTESDDISVFLVPETPELVNLELVASYLESAGYKCKALYTKGYKNSLISDENELFLELKKEFIAVRDSCDSLFINLTNLTTSHKSKLVTFANEIESITYFLLGERDLVKLSGSTQYSKHPIIDKSKEEISFEDLLLKALKNRYDEEESGSNNYSINTDGLRDVISCSKSVENDCIFLEFRDERDVPSYKAVKFLKLNGLTINPDKDSKKKETRLRSILEGARSFNCSILQVIINDKSGANLFLGLMSCKGEKSEVSKEIEEQVSLFQKVIKSVLPGLILKVVSHIEASSILRFINSTQQFGNLVGYPTQPVSSVIIKELENSLSNEQWGMMIVATPLLNQNISKLVKDLDREINYGLKRFEGQFNVGSKVNLLSSMLSSNFDYISKLLKIKEYFFSNRYSGLWSTGNYFFAKKEETYKAIYSLLSARYNSKDPLWEPVRIINLDSFLAQFPKNLQLINVNRSDFYISDELRAYQTVYDSKGLTDFIHVPHFDLKNFTLNKVPDFQTTFPKEVLEEMKYPIQLGEIMNADEEKFYIDLNDLTRHCLIMGSTGSGKTNTILKILMFLKEANYQIPFLIIEPVKKEYRHILNEFDNLQIYTTGKKVNPLKINLFEVPPFLTYKQWINELTAIFSNTFYMWEPLSHILSNGLHELYRINGWTETKIGRVPTLKEFVNYIKLKIDCSDYPLQNRSVYKGAVEARFETLLNGTRAITFNVARSIPSFEEILEHPTIIELDGLRNDDERSLIFNLLIRKLSLYHQDKAEGESLKHLVIVEEAHRFIKQDTIRRDSSEEGLKNRTKNIFSDFLSEVRGFGIGLIISDQKPFNLIDSAITNTDLKICHKLPAWHQIMTFKDSLGLSNNRSVIVSRLKQGECITKLNRVDNPFYINIGLVKKKDWGIQNKITDEVIEERFFCDKKLEQIHFMITAENNEYVLTITELIYQNDQEEKRIANPTEQECRQFSNFKHLLWEQLKSFYKDHRLCQTCEKIITSNAKNRCPECNEVLGGIERIKFPLANQILYMSDFTGLIKLDELYAKRVNLVFSTFDRSSTKALNELKDEFKEIVNSF